MHRKEYIGVTFRDDQHMRELHRAYYGQFVTDEVTALVLRSMRVSKLHASKDPSFNDIPLRWWDVLVGHLPHSVAEKMRECGDYLTQAGGVCILKEAARQIVEAK